MNTATFLDEPKGLQESPVINSDNWGFPCIIYFYCQIRDVIFLL